MSATCPEHSHCARTGTESHLCEAGRPEAGGGVTPTPPAAALSAPSAAETGQEVGREGVGAENGAEGRVRIGVGTANPGLNLSTDPDIVDLIERSSLGTPEAKALRDSVPQELVDRVMARYRAERDAREAQPIEVRNAIEAVAQQLLFNLVDEADWGDYPEIGMDDWQAVVEKARDLATTIDPFAFEAAYALLESRADEWAAAINERNEEDQ